MAEKKHTTARGRAAQGDAAQADVFRVPETRTLQVDGMSRPVKFIRGQEWRVVDDGSTRRAVSEVSRTVWAGVAARLAEAYAQPDPTTDNAAAPGQED